MTDAQLLCIIGALAVVFIQSQLIWRNVMSAANDAVVAVSQQIADARTRINAKISDLEAAIAAAPSADDEVTADALAALKAEADNLDAVAPAPTVEPEPAVAP